KQELYPRRLPYGCGLRNPPRAPRLCTHSVMAGLGSAIHENKSVDPRVKPGDDGIRGGDGCAGSDAASHCGSARGGFGAPDLARDRAGIADRLDEMHAIADLESVEIALHQAVAVEIELRPLMRQDEAVILLWVEL